MNEYFIRYALTMIIRNLLRSSRAVYSTRCVHASKYPSISPHKTSLQRSLGTPLSARRQYAVKSDADSVVEELQELYATAKDEVFPPFFF